LTGAGLWARCNGFGLFCGGDFHVRTAAALAEIPGNAFQGLVGAIVGPLLGKAFVGALGGANR